MPARTTTTGATTSSPGARAPLPLGPGAGRGIGFDSCPPMPNHCCRGPGRGALTMAGEHRYSAAPHGVAIVLQVRCGITMAFVSVRMEEGA